MDGSPLFTNPKSTYRYPDFPIISFLGNTGALHVSPQHIESLYFNRDQQYWVEYRNIRDFGVGADTFSLETRVMNNSPEGGALCKDVVVHLLGGNSSARIPFINPGCISWALMRVSEVTMEDRFNDLSALGQDLSSWKTIRLEVKEGTCKLFLEGKRVYQLPYHQPMGPLKGIKLAFNGMVT